MSREPLAKLEYTKGEDGMLYPNLQISVNKEYDLRPTGMFGRRWKDYMMSKYPQRLSELIALGQINELLEAQPMPETEDMLERAGHMEMITRQAEEIILHEVVYQLR